MMLPEMRGLEVSPYLNEWIVENAQSIVRGVEKGYQNRAMLSVIEYGEVDPFFRRSGRALSEMPICDHSWSELPLPPDCRVVPWRDGKVEIYEETGSVLVCDNHTYIRDMFNQVMCVTPGLFEEAMSEDLRAGERLQILKEKAPDLITIFPDKTGFPGIAVLYGTDEEIFRRLGFRYIDSGSV